MLELMPCPSLRLNYHLKLGPRHIGKGGHNPENEWAEQRACLHTGGTPQLDQNTCLWLAQTSGHGGLVRHFHHQLEPKAVA